MSTTRKSIKGRKLSDAFKRLAKTAPSMNVVYLEMLLEISLSDKPTALDLMDRLGITRISSYERVRRLEESGFVSACPGGRPQGYRLSAAGKRLIKPLLDLEK